jgi:predicted amidophosphoribosyltransferase
LSGLFRTSATIMTELLERAIARVMQLSETEQDAIAALILEELEDEARWDRAFLQSGDLLAKLAAEALAEDEAGKTQMLDPETL